MATQERIADTLCSAPPKAFFQTMDELSGDIIESGTHDDLLAQGSFYAELYNSQFAKVS